MKYRFQLLAIHNHFDAQSPITWFSLFLRAATGRYHNHIAVRILNSETGAIVGVIEAIWPRVKWWNSFEEWEKHATRTVQVLNPVDGRPVSAELLLSLVGVNYGLLDLVQLGRLIFMRNWMGKQYTWNGKRGTGLRHGYQCAELGLTIAGLPDAHLGIPGELIHHPAFTLGEIFYTRKGS